MLANASVYGSLQAYVSNSEFAYDYDEMNVRDPTRASGSIDVEASSGGFTATGSISAEAGFLSTSASAQLNLVGSGVSRTAGFAADSVDAIWLPCYISAGTTIQVIFSASTFTADSSGYVQAYASVGSGIGVQTAYFGRGGDPPSGSVTITYVTKPNERYAPLRVSVGGAASLVGSTTSTRSSYSGSGTADLSRFVVMDPVFGDVTSKIIFESMLGGTAPPTCTDIVPTSLAWGADGGVDFSYAVRDAPLPAGTTVALYWSENGTFDPDRDTPAGYSTAAEQEVGSYGPFHVDRAKITPAPGGTTHLLVVADPPGDGKAYGAVAESDETNNVKAFEVARPDLEAKSLGWNLEDGGVDYSFSIAGSLSSGTSAGFYWSADATFDRGQDQLIAEISLPAGQPADRSDRLPASAFTVAPPAGTRYLFFVVDPDDRIKDEAGEENNAAFAAYEPEITFVGARYDGDPSPVIVGRFFENPPTGPSPITDQNLTVRLSDSLAALRPTLNVGKYSAAPMRDLIGSWDGRTYVTEDFDPGTLDDMAFLVAQARLSGGILDDEDSPRFRVLPLPDWYSALDEGEVTFDAKGGGRYTIKGYIAQLGSSDLFVIPDDVPIVGGRKLGATISYGVRVTAPLDVKQPAAADGFAGISLNVLDLASLEYNLRTDVEAIEGCTMQITLQSSLDPGTLEMDGGFGVTIGVSASKTLAERTFLEGVKLAGIFLVDYGIKGTIALVLNAQVQVALSQGGFQLVGGGGSYLDFGPTTTLTGFANVGWFIPPRFTDPLVSVLRRRFPRYFPSSGNLLPALRLKNELEGSLDLRGRIDYSGGAGSPLGVIDTTVESTINVQVKETLEFLIGEVNLLGVIPPFTVQLFPTVLPKKFKLLG